MDSLDKEDGDNMPAEKLETSETEHSEIKGTNETCPEKDPMLDASVSSPVKHKSKSCFEISKQSTDDVGEESDENLTRLGLEFATKDEFEVTNEESKLLEYTVTEEGKDTEEIDPSEFYYHLNALKTIIHKYPHLYINYLENVVPAEEIVYETPVQEMLENNERSLNPVLLEGSLDILPLIRNPNESADSPPPENQPDMFSINYTGDRASTSQTEPEMDPEENKKQKIGNYSRISFRRIDVHEEPENQASTSKTEPKIDPEGNKKKKIGNYSRISFRRIDVNEEPENPNIHLNDILKERELSKDRASTSNIEPPTTPPSTCSSLLNQFESDGSKNENVTDSKNLEINDSCKDEIKNENVPEKEVTNKKELSTDEEIQKILSQCEQILLDTPTSSPVRRKSQQIENEIKLKSTDNVRIEERTDEIVADSLNVQNAVCIGISKRSETHLVSTVVSSDNTIDLEQDIATNKADQTETCPEKELMLYAPVGSPVKRKSESFVEMKPERSADDIGVESAENVTEVGPEFCIGDAFGVTYEELKLIEMVYNIVTAEGRDAEEIGPPEFYRHINALKKILRKYPSLYVNYPENGERAEAVKEIASKLQCEGLAVHVISTGTQPPTTEARP